MITIYGHDRCGWCKKAKDVATMYSLPYEWKNTDTHENINELKMRLPDVKSVPQIWWDHRYIGGYSELVSEIENTIGGHGEQKF